MALLMNSGAEAVETAVKTARQWGYRVKEGPRDQAEISLREQFPRPTTTIVGFSSEEQYRRLRPVHPRLPDDRLRRPGALERASRRTPSLLVEPIQGRPVFWSRATGI